MIQNNASSMIKSNLLLAALGVRIARRRAELSATHIPADFAKFLWRRILTTRVAADIANTIDLRVD